MDIGIVIPVYHSSDILFQFTKETVESVKSYNHALHVFLIVNGSDKLYYPKAEFFNLHKSVVEFQVIDNPKGNHVGASWNLGIQKSLGTAHAYTVIMNNDLVLNPQCVDNLVAFAEAHPEFTLWSAAEWLDRSTIKEAPLDEVVSEHPHFSCFMVNKKTVETVGYFDENLTMAYFEDGDMHYRVLLSGNKAGKTETAKFYHYGSRTIKVDDALFDQNKRSYEDNRAYVKRKWGVDSHDKVYDPPEEILKDGFAHPFNNSEKGVKDW